MKAEPNHPFDHVPRTAREQVDILSRMLLTAPTSGLQERGSTVTFDISWHGEKSTRQRSRWTPAEQSAYDARRITAMQHVGERMRHFDRPFPEWTVAEIDTLVSAMLAALRATPPAPVPWRARTGVYLNRFNGRNPKNNSFSLSVNVGDHEFTALVDLRAVDIPTRAIVEWMIHVDPYSLSLDHGKRGVELNIAQYKSNSWIPGWPDPDPQGGLG